MFVIHEAVAHSNAVVGIRVPSFGAQLDQIHLIDTADRTCQPMSSDGTTARETSPDLAVK